MLRDYPPGDFPSTVPETLMSNATVAFLHRRQQRRGRYTAKRQALRPVPPGASVAGKRSCWNCARRSIIFFQSV